MVVVIILKKLFILVVFLVICHNQITILIFYLHHTIRKDCKNHFRLKTSFDTLVQFMQFIPSRLSLKLAVYENGKHAFQNEPTDIDLKSLFAN